MNNTERAKFIVGKGYMIGDEVISDFSPSVVSKYVYEDLDKKSRSYKYEVVVKDKNGNELPAIKVSDFAKIDWYRDFGLCDAELTTKKRRKLVGKLQQEAIECTNVKSAIIASPGFYIKDNVPIMIIGSRVFMPIGADMDICSKSKQELKVGQFPDAAFLSEKLINFMPGVSVLMFYGALLGAIKPILNELSVTTDFMMAIVAPSGHLKTTLVRRYALYLKDCEYQEINFSDSMRNDFLQKRLEELSGLCFLLDDYHVVYGTHNKDKFRTRLDQAARVSSGAKNSAFIFVTAESLEDSGIFSALDRIFQVHIPTKNENELKELKSSIKHLPENAVAIIVSHFVQQLINNYAEVKQLVQKYVSEYTHPDWCEDNLRIGNQVKALSLVELLFRTFLCNGNKEQSGYDELMRSICAQGTRQVRQLKQLRYDEVELDYLVEIQKIIEEGTECKNIKVVLTKSAYDDISGEYALMEGNKFILTSKALQMCLMNRLGRPVSLRHVSDRLHDVGILEEDIDSRTKKYFINNKRHYIIDMTVLKHYCDVVKGRLE